ncbi:MAG: hypothetical protein AABN95_27035 [Acidobacteriota bacterium]
MNLLIKVALFVFLSFVSTTFAIAQEQDKPMPDRWRGLILDQSTFDDAVRVLGKPAKDKIGSVSAQEIDNWLTKKRKEKIFRNVQFDKPEGMKKVFLSFLDDKLVMITLQLKNSISPEAISNIYGVPFEPKIGAMNIALNPRDFEHNQGKIYPKTYPTVYSMVAVSERSFVTAMVTNVPSLLGALGKSAGVADKPGSFPGKVEFITLVSRTLENRDGADVLK